MKRLRQLIVNNQGVFALEFALTFLPFILTIYVMFSIFYQAVVNEQVRFAAKFVTRDTKVLIGSNDYQARAEAVWNGYVQTSFLNRNDMTIAIAGYDTLNDVVNDNKAGSLDHAKYALYTFTYRSPSLFNLFGGLNDAQVYSVLAVQEAKIP